MIKEKMKDFLLFKYNSKETDFIKQFNLYVFSHFVYSFILTNEQMHIEVSISESQSDSDHYILLMKLKILDRNENQKFLIQKEHLNPEKVVQIIKDFITPQYIL